MPSHPRISRPELASRLQVLMFLRVLFVSLFLGASFFILVRETRTYFGYIQNFHFLLLATVFSLTFFYVLILRTAKHLVWFAYLQLLVDTLFVTAIIYSTGGIDSIFSFLYILTIIGASIILYRRGAILVASSSSIFFGLLLDLQFYGWIHPLGATGMIVSESQRVRLFYFIVANMAAFYLVAFLSSYLSEQNLKSRVQLKAKQLDLDKLEVLKESIINSIGSALIAVDAGDKIILSNPDADKFFLRGTFPSLLGRDIQHILPDLGDYIYRREGTSELALRGGTPFVDFPFDGPDHSPIHLRLSVSPLRFGSNPEQGHILVFQDVTTIKKIEQKMKKVEDLALVGELAAGIAHEIRNPMASISGSIQMIKENLSKDDINNRLMEIVLREIKRLNELVNDFLIFARPKKAKLKEFDLNELILESLELFQNSPHWNERIDVSTQLSDSITLVSDPELVKQVLWNLFSNAFEAMPHGGALHVTAQELDGHESHQNHQSRIRIAVRDTGKGFEASAMSHLFTPFFTTKEEGSGLGLATVKRVMDTLQGEIYGENHPEGGAQVTLFLPSFPSGLLQEETRQDAGLGKSEGI